MTKHFDGRMGRHAHCDCRQCRGERDQSTAGTRDFATPTDWNSLVTAALGSQFFPAGARKLIASQDWSDMITAAVKGRPFAPSPARRGVLDALKIAAAPARDVRKYYGLSAEDRAGVDAANYLSTLLETQRLAGAASPVDQDDPASRAAFATDGANLRDRARANGAKAIGLMQKAADSFWSAAPKPSKNKRIDDVNAANADFWS